MLDQARQPDRHDEEQPDREQRRDHHRPGPGAARDLLLLLRKLGVGRDARVPACRSPATRPAPPRRGSPASGRRAGAWSSDSSGNDLHVISPSVAAPRRAACARRRAHVRAPRIITPSSTAWPPRGASRDAVRRPCGLDRAGRRALARLARAPGRPARRTPRAPPAPGSRGRAPALGDAPLEALDATAGVDQLLPAGVERVAGGADLDVDLGLGRAGHELVAARAAYVSVDVLGMDIGLHGLTILASRVQRPGRPRGARQRSAPDAPATTDAGQVVCSALLFGLTSRIRCAGSTITVGSEAAVQSGPGRSRSGCCAQRGGGRSCPRGSGRGRRTRP